ncbi:MAG: hypothetical protein N839_0014410 [Desulfofustis sp. PB-SRB1]|mgnify:CR=1 FL=1|jgi:hypothetical protein|nr:hypothetical protein [Desulfofustis sp. PB-SRB1]MBM1003586.1 hypothetical protein [Desulfofustis sp. PB-SRB1]HBH30874.1 hypothetical protein [Desulfofustis sp.]
MAATNNTEKRRVDEQLARLALASGSSESAKTCPDIDTLSTLIEDPGRCRDRDTILAHLAGCEACYQQWVDLSKAYAKETVHTKRRTIIKMIVRPRYLAAAGSALAVAASVLLYLGIPSEQLRRATVRQELDGQGTYHDSPAETMGGELTESESDAGQPDRAWRVYSGREDPMDEAEPAKRSPDDGVPAPVGKAPGDQVLRQRQAPSESTQAAVEKPQGPVSPPRQPVSEQLEFADRGAVQSKELSVVNDEKQSLLNETASTASAGVGKEEDKEKSMAVPRSSATTMGDSAEDTFHTQGGVDSELGASLNEPAGRGAAVPAPVVMEPEATRSAPAPMLHGSTDSSRLKEEQAEFNSTSSPNMSALAIAEEVAPVAGEYHAYPQFIDHLRLLCTQEVPPTDDELEAIREKAALLAAETTTSAADRDHLQALIEVLGKDETEPQGFALLCGRLSDSGEGK